MGAHNFKRQNKNTLVAQACERVDKLEKQVRELKLKNKELTEQLSLAAVSKQSELLKCGNKNPPCCANLKHGFLICDCCDWSE